MSVGLFDWILQLKLNSQNLRCVIKNNENIVKLKGNFGENTMKLKLLIPALTTTNCNNFYMVYYFYLRRFWHWNFDNISRKINIKQQRTDTL